ncbi:MAG TPA: FAD-binding oxidoreductase [Usitatibacter sp.]|nr:FAD-binding oxidoreductase [Usitatibacter sp.]
MKDASKGVACDVAVIGGGLVGSAIAWGLARVGQRVVVLDEGDIALRASRGNFALVWVQNKGNGLAPYAAWTLNSAQAWPDFARELLEETGLDVKYQRPGGFHMVLSEREYEARQASLERLHQQPGMPHYDWEMMDHARVRSLLPDIGPDVVGASFSAWDGHCNSLRLFRALNAAMQKRGVTYRSDDAVSEVRYETGEFRLFARRGEVRASKVVLAAGIANARIGPMVGLDVPVRPQRGQLIVTEKVAPFLDYPISTIRQTDEGGVMLGDSQEEQAEPVVGHRVIAVLADRARRMFPKLGPLNIVRTWAALRVMTKDGFPIYEESAQCPGAFVATCHSGVTLAAGHALSLAPLLARGELPPDRFQPFSTRRFHVQKAA